MNRILRPAIYLDRDGTVNVEKNYLHRIEDWEWIPGAIEAIRMINESGYLAIIVTNQAGVARGYYHEDDVHKLHAHVDELLASHKAYIDGYYYCPHHPGFGENRDCQCRKPKPGMLLAAEHDFHIDLSRSFLIGDKISDIEAAVQIGVMPLFVLTGHGEKERSKLSRSVVQKRDILDAVQYALTEVRGTD